MLSFITYELLKSPHAYAMVRNEVDTVLQGKPIQPEHFGKLPYIVAVMREGLRLYPPVAVIGVTPFEDTVIGGKYLVKKGNTAALHIPFLHRDPLVYGEDAEKFRPERMLDGKFDTLPVSRYSLCVRRSDSYQPKAWLPFGNGARACIVGTLLTVVIAVVNSLTGSGIRVARSHHRDRYALPTL
jgi:cytochrome P450/NADPH-cytochrome P450 reductase